VQLLCYARRGLLRRDRSGRPFYYPPKARTAPALKYPANTFKDIDSLVQRLQVIDLSGADRHTKAKLAVMNLASLSLNNPHVPREVGRLLDLELSYNLEVLNEI
jgi:hypothetical protein